MTQEPIHTVLRQRREQKGLNLEQMAVVLGVSERTVSRIEAGHTPYSQTILEDYAKTLGCSVRELFSPQFTTKELTLLMKLVIETNDRAITPKQQAALVFKIFSILRPTMPPPGVVEVFPPE